MPTKTFNKKYCTEPETENIETVSARAIDISITGIILSSSTTTKNSKILSTTPNEAQIKSVKQPTTKPVLAV